MTLLGPALLVVASAFALVVVVLAYRRDASDPIGVLTRLYLLHLGVLCALASFDSAVRPLCIALGFILTFPCSLFIPDLFFGWLGQQGLTACLFVAALLNAAAASLLVLWSCRRSDLTRRCS